MHHRGQFPEPLDPVLSGSAPTASDPWLSYVPGPAVSSLRPSASRSRPNRPRRSEDRLSSSPAMYFPASSCAVVGSVLSKASAANWDSPDRCWTDALRSPSKGLIALSSVAGRVNSLIAISASSLICSSWALVRRHGPPRHQDSAELIQARIKSIQPVVITATNCEMMLDLSSGSRDYRGS
jgi:hypothetical protein